MVSLAALFLGLRGVASQTYDTVPIGYAFGGDGDQAPNWTINQTVFEAAGGFTAGTNGATNAIYGEVPMGEGRIRVLGALLPDPTEDFYHPFGLQNYAVTYTGYTLLANMLLWENPAQTQPAPVVSATPQPAVSASSSPVPAPAASATPAAAPATTTTTAPLPTTGGGFALLGLAGMVGAAVASRFRRRAD